jgi:hypothetical protein
MRSPKSQRAKKKVNDWSQVKRFLKEKPITKAEKTIYIPNKFDKEAWTW